jgi:hypothetical protein
MIIQGLELLKALISVAESKSFRQMEFTGFQRVAELFRHKSRPVLWHLATSYYNESVKLFFLFLVLLSGAAFAEDIESTPCGVTVEDLVAEGQGYTLDARNEATMAKVLEAISAQLRKTPYKNGASGEGNLDVYDTDPLWRLDAFDCTTFVETVMAASLATDRASFEKKLAEIRYADGRQDFLDRNHFPEIDWIANNVKAGFVTDITEKLFPALKKTASAVVDKGAWFAAMNADSIEPKERDLAEREKLAAELRAKAKNYAPVAISLNYLPVAAFFKSDSLPKEGSTQNAKADPAVLRRIPSGTIFNVVREGWPQGGSTPLLVSHQGFVIQKRRATYMRHAAQGKEVMDVPLAEYFEKYLQGPTTVRGINLLQVNLPAKKP